MQTNSLLGLFFALACCVGCAGPHDRYEASDRMIEFAGQQWEIREGPSPGGAGRNHWGTSEASIAQDTDGLILRLTHNDAVWRAAELRAPLPRGAARVEFDVEVESGEVADNAVLGIFVYSDDAHEADIECARWGDRDALPWQHALHTHRGPTVSRFSQADSSESTHSITWRRRMVTWSSASEESEMRRVERLTVGRRLGVRFVHINLWLDRGRPPGEGTTDVRVTDVRIYDHGGQRLNP